MSLRATIIAVQPQRAIIDHNRLRYLVKTSFNENTAPTRDKPTYLDTKKASSDITHGLSNLKEDARRLIKRAR